MSFSKKIAFRKNSFFIATVVATNLLCPLAFADQVTSSAINLSENQQEKSIKIEKNDNIISEKQALIIAKNFSASHAKGQFSSWKNASKFSANSIYSADNFLVAYEISVKSDDGEDLGWIVVSAIQGQGKLVTSFFNEGKSSSELLNDDFLEKLKISPMATTVKVVEKKIIGSITGPVALKVKFDKNPEIIDSKETEDNYFVFTNNPTIPYETLNFKKFDNIQIEDISEQLLKEESELRNALLSGDFSSNLFIESRSEKIDGFDRNISNIDISGTFSEYWQENRAWTLGGLTKGLCYAGCAPLAWAILLDYWDRNGFPKLIGSEFNNNHPSHLDGDIVWTINELRGNLNTICTPGGQGQTFYSDHPNGAIYARARGYKSSSAVNTSSAWSYWWDLISAVNEKKPPIAGISTNNNGVMNHAVVVYSYTDNWGVGNDNYCVRTGWPSPKAMCYTGQSTLLGLTRVNIGN